MSEATDLIADVKRSVARVERGITNFEKDIETIGAWTDLAQLRIAASRLRLFEDSLRARRVDLEEATTPEASEPVSEPEPVVEESVAPQEPAVDAPSDPVEEAVVPETPADTETQDAPVADVGESEASQV